MNRFVDRIINKLCKLYIMFHSEYYRFFNKDVRTKMKCILSLTESNTGLTAAGQIERALPGFTRYRKARHYKYMLGRYLYSLKYIRNKAALDCACGLGWGSFLISDYTRELLSIDLDKNAIDFSNSTWKSAKLNFIQHSALELDSLNRKFDVILCFELIEHLQFSDGAKLLQQANRVLAENGLIILSSWFPGTQETGQNKGLKNEFHLHLYTKEEMRDLLARSGFSKPRFLGSFMVIAANGKNSKP